MMGPTIAQKRQIRIFVLNLVFVIRAAVVSPQFTCTILYAKHYPPNPGQPTAGVGVGQPGGLGAKDGWLEAGRAQGE